MLSVWDLLGPPLRLLEAYGWFLVAAALLFYLGRQQYRTWSAKRLVEQGLKEANDPARRAVLDKEVARIREEQQRAYLEAAARRRAEAAEVERARLAAGFAATHAGSAVARGGATTSAHDSDSDSGGFNHLSPPPSRTMRFKRACAPAGG